MAYNPYAPPGSGPYPGAGGMPQPGMPQPGMPQPGMPAPGGIGFGAVPAPSPYGGPAPGAYQGPPGGYGQGSVPPAGYGGAPAPAPQAAYGAPPPVAQPGYGAAYGAPPPVAQPGYGAAYGQQAPPPQQQVQPGYAQQAPPPQQQMQQQAPQGQPGYAQQAPPPQQQGQPGYAQQAPPPQQQAQPVQQQQQQQQQQPAAAQGVVHVPVAEAAAVAVSAPTDNVTVAMQAMNIHGSLGGTLKPDPNFDAETEATNLRNAMKGVGTNEKALIDVLGTHTMAEREQIAKMFKTMYGKDLGKDMKSETSFNFQELLLKLIQGAAVFDGMEVRAAMKGAGTDELALIEILCSRTNAEIEAIKNYFKIDLNRDLEKDIISETSGHFKRLLVSMSTANRDETTKVDDAKAQKEAQDLYSAGEKKLGTDESRFNQILALRNFHQLNCMYAHYTRLSGYDITRSIEHEMSGDLKKGFLCVVECSRNPAQYFANALHKSMKGAGTDDRTLIRIIVSRAEKDLEDIKACFIQTYKKTLGKMIKDDCSGHYKNLLLKIVGN